MLTGSPRKKENLHCRHPASPNTLSQRSMMYFSSFGITVSAHKLMGTLGMVIVAVFVLYIAFHFVALTISAAETYPCSAGLLNSAPR